MSESSLKMLTQKVIQVSDIYAARCDINRDDDWYALKLTEEFGEQNAEYLRMTGRARKKGMSSQDIQAAMGAECADVFAHLMLFAAHNGIDLEKELDAKWLSRLEHKDG
ncbi:phosphoribosyl-ATP pyrophosphohydrolase [Maritalea sp.]|uniref:phosphoribosyl-ATP pyrophosphohydrolase n=1 Tax=Maritalea sp. TaxID=2003361 RepID=UPI003EF7AB48